MSRPEYLLYPTEEKRREALNLDIQKCWQKLFEPIEWSISKQRVLGIGKVIKERAMDKESEGPASSVVITFKDTEITKYRGLPISRQREWSITFSEIWEKAQDETEVAKTYLKYDPQHHAIAIDQPGYLDNIFLARRLPGFSRNLNATAQGTQFYQLEFFREMLEELNGQEEPA